MRKIILLEHVSLDGFVAGPNGEMDWISFDDKLVSYVHALHDMTDAAIYGRVTYQMMQGYWPTVLENPASSEGDRNHARWYDNATKIVVSRTLQSDAGNKTVVVGKNLAEEMTKIKQQPGKNLWMIGSPSAVHAFTQLGLIDEYWLNINPVILGSGIPLFAGSDKQPLKLIESNTFAGGIVALRYEASR